MAKVPALGNDPFLRGAAPRAPANEEKPAATPPPSHAADADAAKARAPGAAAPTRKAGGPKARPAPAPAKKAAAPPKPSTSPASQDEEKAAPAPKPPSPAPARAKKATVPPKPPTSPAPQDEKKAAPAPKPAAPPAPEREKKAKRAGRPAPARKARAPWPQASRAPTAPEAKPPAEEPVAPPARPSPVFEGELVDEIPRRPLLPPPSTPPPAAAGLPAPEWLARARQAASGLIGQAVELVLSNALAQRAIESALGNPVTHRVASAAAQVKPAFEAAIGLLPPAAEATRTAVAAVVSGQALRGVVGTTVEAAAAVRQVARRSEPAIGEVDAFGEDPGMLSRAEPLLDFLHERYFRVETLDAGRVPPGACLLVCNHSGVLPLDGPMLRTALRRDLGRADGRWLVEDALFHAPVLGTLLNRLGAVRACPENAERLLAQGAALAVFPEGLLWISKPVNRRYQLQRFGRGGFVKVALRARVPIVPVAIVGAEEASPLLARIPMKALGFPYLPVTPTFPFLGPLGLLPFPTKWTVSFLEPLTLDEHGPEDADDPALVARLTAEVRDGVQRELDRLLERRRSVLSG